MTPTTFPQANINFGPPADLDDSQCGTIPGFAGAIKGGNMDGQKVVIVAWMPSEDDLCRLIEGAPIFITFCGGLSPHFVSTEFPTQ